MKSLKSLLTVLCAVLVMACFHVSTSGQTRSQSADTRVANVRAEGMAVRFESAIPYSTATLTVSGPDGVVYRRQFEGGTQPSFALFGKTGAPLGDGQYTYELTFTTLQQNFKDQSMARRDDDGVEDEQGRINRSRLPVQGSVQSGSFAVLNGTLYVGNETEPTIRRDSPNKNSDSPTKGPDKNLDRNPQTRTPGVISSNTLNRLRNHRAALLPMFDQVIPDDLIIQGSTCGGLDCVNNETFNFDTIRLKENNTRISFNDTSVAPFPTNDWTIRANSSASGGASFLAFVDRGASESGDETGTIVFEVDAGAPANALKVSSTGKVGLRTATPVLDLHIATSDTPAHRLEQNSSGGFTAQTWDIAGNEANFFVRDVTGGSRLPFRIRPGAPTSSIDINASGQVGIGTASPSTKLEVVAGSIADGVRITGTTAGTISPAFKLFDSATQRGALGLAEGAGHFSGDAVAGDIVFQATTGKLLLQSGAGTSALAITTTNNVGIGTAAPTLKLSVLGDANKSVGGGSWQVFSDERLKTISGRFNSGLKAVMQLQPIRFQYRKDNVLGLQSELENIGFGAQALQKVIPEAVTRNANGYLQVNNDPILWTMLNAIKEQQKEIVELKGQIQKLQSASQRRHAKSRR